MPPGTRFEAWVTAGHLAAKVSFKLWNITAGGLIGVSLGRSKDGLYEPALADSEREAVADLLGYLENVRDGYHPPIM